MAGLRAYGLRPYSGRMGYAEYDIRLSVREDDAALRRAVAKAGNLGEFSMRIVRKSLDARRKGDVRWQYRVGVLSPELAGGEDPFLPPPEPEFRRREERAVVVGSGPAGIFAADWLSRAGFKVTVLERGSRVDARRAAIEAFEAGGPFPAADNYAFGEGGAGTFSDGKLSSRTKGISRERDCIFARFVEAGAPEEIRYMTHPHLGSDNLFGMTGAMRAALEARGVTFLFNSPVTGLASRDGRVTGVETPAGVLEAERFLFACGHSATETWRMLMRAGVAFRPKNFALGFRAEHLQETVNLAQWGAASLPGVKAAEYRLTHQAAGGVGVYSFCMCPGGTVVPAMAYPGTNLVNGKSDYARAGRHANAAVVAGLSLRSLLGRELDALESIEWLEALERSFHDFAGGYRAPAMTIADFLAGGSGSALPESSHPLGLVPADLAELAPAGLVAPLREGLAAFCRTLEGYGEGLLLGLESKTSAPIQVLRSDGGLAAGFSNLWIAGEGSGWSGGIVSSAADGLKAAMSVEASG